MVLVALKCCKDVVKAPSKKPGERGKIRILGGGFGGGVEGGGGALVLFLPPALIYSLRKACGDISFRTLHISAFSSAGIVVLGALGTGAAFHRATLFIPSASPPPPSCASCRLVPPSGFPRGRAACAELVPGGPWLGRARAVHVGLWPGHGCVFRRRDSGARVEESDMVESRRSTVGSDGDPCQRAECRGAPRRAARGILQELRAAKQCDIDASHHGEFP